MPLEIRDSSLLCFGGWSIDLVKDGALRFVRMAADRARSDLLTSGETHLRPGEWHHIAASASRANGGGKMALFIDGLPVGSADVLSPQLSFDPPIRVGSGMAGFFRGLVDDVRVYGAHLEKPQIESICDAGLPWIRNRLMPEEHFAGRFELRKNDVVVTAGGEEAAAAQEDGYLETILSAAHPEVPVFFRGMAWEGDTAGRQYRVVNFGPWSEHLERVKATVIVAQFGQLESLSGSSGLAEFRNSYGALLDEFARRTGRVVLVSPHRFEEAGPLFPPAGGRNADLEKYVEVIRQLAAERHFLFVDLFAADKLQSPRRLTRDGVHLTVEGQALAAREIARQLGMGAVAERAGIDEGGAFADADLEKIRGLVREKNRWWSEYWRPTNWAFLAGDRVEQPSSRDHVDPRIRWFPVEVQGALALIRADEIKIAELTRGGAR